MQAQSYGGMWAYGQHFRIESVDVRRMTQDSGIVARFEQQSRASVRDANVIGDELRYVGVLEQIIEANFRCFKIVLLKVRWFQVIYRGPNATMRKEKSGFYAVDSSKLLTRNDEPFVLPRHAEQAFFYKDGIDPKWWHVIHVPPRGRRMT